MPSVPAELAPIIETIGPSASIHVVAGGDHFKLARKDPAAQAEGVRRSAHYGRVDADEDEMSSSTSSLRGIRAVRIVRLRAVGHSDAIDAIDRPSRAPFEEVACRRRRAAGHVDVRDVRVLLGSSAGLGSFDSTGQI
jgi:hypothetical protein